jgi:hypothetical protein
VRIIVSVADLQTVRAGDRVVAIDGENLDSPLTVEAPLGAGGAPGVKLVHESTAGVEWYLYPGEVMEAVTIERDAPGQPKRKTTRRRPDAVTIRRFGIPLVRGGDGIYRTEDGRYQIFLHDGYVTHCFDPHPVRTSREEGGGYLCPGGQEHAYSLWVIWDITIDDYMRDTDGFETFGEAARVLARWYEKKT